MKKLTILFLLMCLVSPTIQAQNNYANNMDYIFGQIDKQRINTGLLKEYGIRLNEVENYNGTLTSARIFSGDSR